MQYLCSPKTNLKMRTQRILFLILISALLSLNSCSNNEEPQCMGNKITVTTWLEYRYLLNGKLVHWSTTGLQMRIINGQPQVMYDNGELAERHVTVIYQYNSEDKETVAYKCNSGIIKTFDGTKEGEDSKNYTYVYKGWYSTSEYYK